MVYSVSMWFILFPKLEKFGLLGILQHYELVAEKLLLKVNCVIFIEERERIWVTTPVPRYVDMQMSFEVHARGKSQICRINRKGKIWGWVDLRENLNMVLPIFPVFVFMPHCLHVHISYRDFLECGGLVLLQIRLYTFLVLLFSFISLCFIPVLLSLAERSFLWS